MTDKEIDEALDNLRDEFAYGGSVDEEREQYNIGKLVRKALQKKKEYKKKFLVQMFYMINYHRVLEKEL